MIAFLLALRMINPKLLKKNSIHPNLYQINTFALSLLFYTKGEIQAAFVQAKNQS